MVTEHKEAAMRRPIVLVDCDGVLADFVGGVLELVENVTGLAYEPHDVDQFDFCKALKIGGLDASLIKHKIGAPGFCTSLAPYDGARKGIEALREIAEVYIVTSPWNSCATWTSERESWLWRHFKVPHSHIVHTSAKHLVCGDVFVDDKTSMVAAWESAWPDRVAVRWNTPHNRNDQWDGVRCASWERLAEIVQGVR